MGDQEPMSDKCMKNPMSSTISRLGRLNIASTTNRGENVVFFSAACLFIIVMVQFEISAGIGPFRCHREYAFPFGPGIVIKVDVKLGPFGPSSTATTVYCGWHANLELGLKRANNVDNADHVHGGAAARGHGIAAGDGHGVAAVDGHGVAARNGML